MPDPTPGETAYAAYRQKFLAYQHHTSGTVMPEAWERLPLLVQICWETAADALLCWRAEGVEDTGFAPPGTYRKDTPHA